MKSADNHNPLIKELIGRDKTTATEYMKADGL